MTKILILFTAISILSCNPKKVIVEKPNLQPNIVLIFTDDQGYNDVGVFGANDIDTPNLDQMAKDGVRLTNYYAAQAVCSASRAGILTGCYPNRIGIHNAMMPNSKIGLHPTENYTGRDTKSQRL